MRPRSLRLGIGASTVFGTFLVVASIVRTQPDIFFTGLMQAGSGVCWQVGAFEPMSTRVSIEFESDHFLLFGGMLSVAAKDKQGLENQFEHLGLGAGPIAVRSALPMTLRTPAPEWAEGLPPERCCLVGSFESGILYFAHYPFFELFGPEGTPFTLSAAFPADPAGTLSQNLVGVFGPAPSGIPAFDEEARKYLANLSPGPGEFPFGEIISGTFSPFVIDMWQRGHIVAGHPLRSLRTGLRRDVSVALSVPASTVDIAGFDVSQLFVDDRLYAVPANRVIRLRLKRGLLRVAADRISIAGIAELMAVDGDNRRPRWLETWPVVAQWFATGILGFLLGFWTRLIDPIEAKPRRQRQQGSAGHLFE